jgi:hypothetical protein
VQQYGRALEYVPQNLYTDTNIRQVIKTYANNNVSDAAKIGAYISTISLHAGKADLHFDFDRLVSNLGYGLNEYGQFTTLAAATHVIRPHNQGMTLHMT